MKAHRTASLFLSLLLFYCHLVNEQTCTQKDFLNDKQVTFAIYNLWMQIQLPLPSVSSGWETSIAVWRSAVPPVWLQSTRIPTILSKRTAVYLKCIRFTWGVSETLSNINYNRSLSAIPLVQLWTHTFSLKNHHSFIWHASWQQAQNCCTPQHYAALQMCFVIQSDCKPYILSDMPQWYASASDITNYLQRRSIIHLQGKNEA